MGRVSYCALLMLSPCSNLTEIDDELEIEDFAWDAQKKVYHYPCPCGDRFEINKTPQKQLADGQDVATCPSCSLIVRVIYDYIDYQHCADDEEPSAPPLVLQQPIAAAA